MVEAYQASLRIEEKLMTKNKIQEEIQDTEEGRKKRSKLRTVKVIMLQYRRLLEKELM